MNLNNQLLDGSYRHGRYHNFTIYDPKQREIIVAEVKDRVVHRMVYEYLVRVWDKSFCFDAWSCRVGKGLHGAIQRTSHNMEKYKDGWLWRSDIAKFFNNIDHDRLKFLLRTKIDKPNILDLLDKIIDSYHYENKRGIPIGNLTSQIFANIYLNELDQFVLHSIKPLAYVRYGDDFIIWCTDEYTALCAQAVIKQFLCDELGLSINLKHDLVQPTRNKLSYLGVDIWPSGRRLSPKVMNRIDKKLDAINSASYYSLIKHHLPDRYRRRFQYKILDILEHK